MLEALIFIITLYSTPGGRHSEPAVIPPDVAMAIYAASRHHGVDPLEVAAVVAAENEGREYNELEVGRYNCKGEGCEAGVAQLKRVFQRLADKRCNAQLRALHDRYQGRDDCLYIGPQQRVRRKLKSRRPDRVVYRFPGEAQKVALTLDPHALRAEIKAKKGRLYEHRAGTLVGNPRDVDLFMMRVNIEALVIGVEEMKRWQHQYAPQLKCVWPDKSVKKSCWQPNFRCARDAYAMDGSWVTQGCLGSVNRLIRWEWNLRQRHAKLVRLAADWLPTDPQETAEGEAPRPRRTQESR